jgi:hypothetical protein
VRRGSGTGRWHCASGRHLQRRGDRDVGSDNRRCGDLLAGSGIIWPPQRLGKLRLCLVPHGAAQRSHGSADREPFGRGYQCRRHCHGNLFLLTITHPPTEATTCDSNRLALRSRRLERPLLASRDNAVRCYLAKHNPEPLSLVHCLPGRPGAQKDEKA